MEFRKMRRFKQQLSEESCVEILKNEPRGVMAVAGENGYPYAFPIDFVYDGGRLYFHCAKEGHKLDALKNCDKVSFCVMNEGLRTLSRVCMLELEIDHMTGKLVNES